MTLTQYFIKRSYQPVDILCLERHRRGGPSRFVFSAIATSGAGVILALLGWKLLGLMMIPVLLVCLVSTWQYSLAMRKANGTASRPAEDGS